MTDLGEIELINYNKDIEWCGEKGNIVISYWERSEEEIAGEVRGCKGHVVRGAECH